MTSMPVMPVASMPAMPAASMPAMPAASMPAASNNISTMLIPIKVDSKFEIDTWKNDLTPTVYNPPPYGFCKMVYIPEHVSIGKLIGKNGSVFNAITRDTQGIIYMWFNNKNNTIEIWSTNLYGLEIASKKIFNRMYRLK